MFKLKWPLIITIFTFSVVISQTDKNVDFMTKMSYTFRLRLLQCANMARASQPMLDDIYQYWDMKHNLTQTATGCLLLCAMSTLNLLDDQGKLHMANAEGYIKAKGGDDEVVSNLMNTYLKCREAQESQNAGADSCVTALSLLKCFRQVVTYNHWAPDIDTLLSMIM